MSCDSRNRLIASASGRNGIAGYLNRSLGILGSWGTVERLFSGDGADLANQVLNLAGLRLEQKTASQAAEEARREREPVVSRKVKLNGVAGLMIGVHALEQATGVAATLAARAVLRGKPTGTYRGVILRRSPLASLPGPGRNAEGFYFHQGGRTWVSRTAQYPVSRDTVKTLTTVRSLSLPGRAFYFDRKMDERDVVDVVLGERDPDTLPGFLGYTGELDSLAPALGLLKKGLMGLNWLSIDETERETRGLDFIDYTAPGSSYRQTAHSHSYPSAAPVRTVTYADMARSAGRQVDTRNIPVREGYGGPPPPPEPPPPPPEAYVSDLWGNSTRPEEVIAVTDYAKLAAEAGRELAPPKIDIPGQGLRPLRVRSLDLLKGPGGSKQMRASADYEYAPGQWRPITDDKIREALANTVAMNFNEASAADGRK